jgi:plastocyanin
LKRRYIFLIIILFFALLITGCSNQERTTAPPSQSNEVTINLTAKNLAFDKSSITVPPGARVRIVFENQDNGIQHNFAVYENSDAKNSIFVGGLITGVATITYEFNAPAKEGIYFFRCDVHPMMNGQFIVKLGSTDSTQGTSSNIGY